jgi:hypothetical protein
MNRAGLEHFPMTPMSASGALASLAQALECSTRRDRHRHHADDGPLVDVDGEAQLLFVD